MPAPGAAPAGSRAVAGEARFRLEVLDHFRLGLRSIRDALDCFVRAEPGGAGRDDPRERRLIQLWLQFLIIHCVHEWARDPGLRDRADAVARLHRCWADLVAVERAAIVPVPGEIDAPLLAFIDGGVAELRGLRALEGPAEPDSLRLRAFVARQLLARLRSDEADSLPAIIIGRRRGHRSA